MKPLVSSFVGRLASLLFITTATLLWAIAALLVWISGNGTATCGPRRFAK